MADPHFRGYRRVRRNAIVEMNAGIPMPFYAASPFLQEELDAFELQQQQIQQPQLNQKHHSQSAMTILQPQFSSLRAVSFSNFAAPRPKYASTSTSSSAPFKNPRRNLTNAPFLSHLQQSKHSRHCSAPLPYPSSSCCGAIERRISSVDFSTRLSIRECITKHCYFQNRYLADDRLMLKTFAKTFGIHTYGYVMFEYRKTSRTKTYKLLATTLMEGEENEFEKDDVETHNTKMEKAEKESEMLSSCETSNSSAATAILHEAR